MGEREAGRDMITLFVWLFKNCEFVACCGVVAVICFFVFFSRN